MVRKIVTKKIKQSKILLVKKKFVIKTTNTQLTFTRSNSTIEILEQGATHAQSLQ